MVRGAAFRPETGHSARGITAARGYALPVPALTDDQLELLQRAHDGLPMWGGSLAIARVRRDVDLLLTLRLVEPAGANPYRLTTLGATVLDAVSRRPS